MSIKSALLSIGVVGSSLYFFINFADFFEEEKKVIDSGVKTADLAAVTTNGNVTDQLPEKKFLQPGKTIAAKAPSVWRKLDTVGSEGYAPIITNALNGGGDAVLAADLVRKCKTVSKDAERIFELGSSPEMAKHARGYAKTVEYIQAEQRRCQTVTHDLLQLRPQLLLKGVEGGEIGAAAKYIAEQTPSTGFDASQNARLLAGLRADGQKGDLSSLLILSAGNSQYSESSSDREIYMAAYRAIVAKHPNGVDATLRASLQSSVDQGLVKLSDFSFFGVNKLSEEQKPKVAAIVESHERNRISEPQ